MKELRPETRDFILQHADEDIHQLALQSSRFPQVEMTEAICQIAARQTARTKLPSWWKHTEIRYPKHLSMEQCSSEITARYKAGLIPQYIIGGSMTDLSGGLGVDFYHLAKQMNQATYVEKQAELCELAQYNFPLLGLGNAEVIQADSTAYLATLSRQDLLFIDPARRDNTGKKVVAISDCEPDIAAIQQLLLAKSTWVMVKLSPMLDITQTLNLLPHTQEVHVVAVNGECKELLLLLTSEADSNRALIHCVNLSADEQAPLPETFKFTADEEAASVCEYANAPEAYLYEPHAAILKGGAYRIVAQRYGLKKLHPNSHLYTASHCVSNFPGRTFTVSSYGGFSKKELKELPKKANVSIRNFPSKVEDLKKKLKIIDGGEEYLFATTLHNGEKKWIRCRKADTN